MINNIIYVIIVIVVNYLQIPIMKIKKILQDIGLSDIEAQVYLYLRKKDGATATEVANGLDIQRTRVYPVIKNLARKALVLTYQRSGSKYFHAVKPEKLLHIYEKKLELLSDIIPAIEALGGHDDFISGLRYIDTVSELRRFYLDVAQSYKGKKLEVVGDNHYWESMLGEDFVLKFRKEKAKNKIKTRLIATGQSEDFVKTNKKLLLDVKYLPKQYFFKTAFHIFPDQILVSTPHKTSVAVLIAVPAMTDVFKNIFEALWDNVAK